MKKLILFLIILVSSIAFSQPYISRIDADSLGQIVKIPVGEAPAYIILTDSLTDYADTTLATTKTLEFYVFVGDTSGGYTIPDTSSDGTPGFIGKIDSTKWTLLSAKDDGSTVYSVTLKQQRFIPLTFNNVISAIGIPAKRNSGLFIMPYVVNGVGTLIKLKIGTMKLQ